MNEKGKGTIINKLGQNDKSQKNYTKLGMHISVTVHNVDFQAKGLFLFFTIWQISNLFGGKI